MPDYLNLGCAQPQRAFQMATPWKRWIVALLVATTWGLFKPELTSAQSGTLMQWNSAQAGEGGPDLDEPLVTDRPDFTEASVTVGKGVVQVESGYTYSFDNDGTDQTIADSFPETLLRVGVWADWLEFRVAYNYATEQVNGVRDSGSEDLYLGMKLALTGQAGILPEMAILPQATVPTGDDGFTADEFEPGLNWVYSWEINDFLSLAGSSQLNRTIEELVNEPHTEFAQSFSLGYSLGDRWGAYTEWFVLVPHSSDNARNEHYFNGGLTFLITDNIVWDIRAGVGLDDDADDYFAGSGLSFRFNN